LKRSLAGIRVKHAVRMAFPLKCDEETLTEFASESCEAEQRRRRIFSTSNVVIGLCVALVVAATLALREEPATLHGMTEDDDSLWELAEAKKKKTEDDDALWELLEAKKRTTEDDDALWELAEAKKKMTEDDDAMWERAEAKQKMTEDDDALWEHAEAKRKMTEDDDDDGR